MHVSANTLRSKLNMEWVFFWCVLLSRGLRGTSTELAAKVLALWPVGTDVPVRTDHSGR
jgi:hypothetical protein